MSWGMRPLPVCSAFVDERMSSDEAKGEGSSEADKNLRHLETLEVVDDDLPMCVSIKL